MVAIASMMRSLGVSRSTTKRPTGDMNAAAAPCRMRAAISAHSEGARPQSKEARVKTPIAEAKTLRAPKRSPAQPAAGTKTAMATR